MPFTHTKNFYWSVLGISLLLAFVQKLPCINGSWGAPDYVQYRTLCYNDHQALYGVRGLDQKKIPYVEEKKFEYPVLIGYQMYLTALLSENHIEFFKVNAVVNSLWAVLTFRVLILCFGYGQHLLWFAMAPPLIFYLNLNWDISTVTMLCLAYYFWKKEKDFWTGVFLSLGFLGKMFPVFAIPALVLDRKESLKKGILGFLTGWIFLNLPILFLDLQKNGDYHALLSVFGFHTARTPDFGTTWYWIGEFFGLGPTTYEFTRIVDWTFLLGMGAFTFFALWQQSKRKSSPWQTTAAITAFCLVISKIHSPQYGIWFLGFYLILKTPWPLIVSYFIADLAVFSNGFWWVASQPDMGPHRHRTLFVIAIAARALALLLLAYEWLFRASERVHENRPALRSPRRR